MVLQGFGGRGEQMSIKLKMILTGAVIVIAGLGLWGTFTTLQLNSTRSEIAATRLTLAATQIKLDQTNTALNDTSLKLSDTLSTLETTNNQLNGVKSELAATDAKLQDTSTSLSRTQSDLYSTQGLLTQSQQTAAELQTTLTQTQQKLTASQNTLTGLGMVVQASKECHDVSLVDNPAAKDPTLAQLKAFLKQDQTETHAYILGVYDCSQFSRDVHNNAEAAGIRAAEVEVLFKNEPVGHALDAFITTDYGLVYIDCTQPPDTFAHVECGKVYRAEDVSNVSPANIRNDQWWDSLYSNYFYIPTSSGGQAVVSRISLFW